MKKEITTEKQKEIKNIVNRKVIFEDASNGEQFLISSTVETEGKGKYTDGKEYPLYKVEVTSASHPFYTGKDTRLDIAGRADKFKKRAAKAGSKK